MMSTPRNDLNAAGNRIAEDFRTLTAHAEELLKATKSASGDGVEIARKHLADSLKQAKDRALDAESRAIERGKAALDATGEMVRDRPWQALAAAVLIGAAIGCVAGSAYKGSAARG